jgi:predicted peptidase
MHVCLLSLLLLFGSGALAEFEAKISRQTSIRSLLSLPSGYRESPQKWPLLFFLHGGSGRGDDISLVSQ